jgi:hypothetical protein
MGLVGTIGLVLLLAFTRIPNPITGNALQNNTIGYVTEIVQIAYIVIIGIIIMKHRRRRRLNVTPEKRS